MVISGRGRASVMAKAKRATKAAETAKPKKKAEAIAKAAVAEQAEAGAKQEAEGKQEAKPRRARSKKTLVKQVIQQFGQKLEKDEVKPTVGDFIRLLQLEKELLDESPKEIKVSWVEPEPATEK